MFVPYNLLIVLVIFSSGEDNGKRGSHQLSKSGSGKIGHGGGNAAKKGGGGGRGRRKGQKAG